MEFKYMYSQTYVMCRPSSKCLSMRYTNHAFIITCIISSSSIIFLLLNKHWHLGTLSAMTSKHLRKHGSLKVFCKKMEE